MAAFYYFLIFILLFDLLRLLYQHIPYFRARPLGKKIAKKISLSIVLLVMFLLGLGTWNAWNTIIVEYEIEIPKQAGEIKELHALMISDIHLGTLVGEYRLQKAVDVVNELKPDIVFLPGDIIDDDLSPLEEIEMMMIFGEMQAPYGIYGVLGNHEYIAGTTDDTIRLLGDIGIEVLVDSHVLIEDSFYIVGRDEYSRVRFGEKRLDLDIVMQNLDRTLPIIMLDHQPVQLDEALAAGVDLQLSGHTHRGQMAPIHLITEKIFEADWGYLQKESLQLIVSSGYATWGPPIRIGSRSEIVSKRLNFLLIQVSQKKISLQPS